MTLKTIRLALARDKEFPDGATNRGYIFKAPLTADGSLDQAAWSKLKQQCSVERFWPGEPDETGHLVHTRGNAWVFHYDTMTKTEKAEAPIFKFDRHHFVEGEYVSITEHDGTQRTFRVLSVR